MTTKKPFDLFSEWKKNQKNTKTSFLQSFFDFLCWAESNNYLFVEFKPCKVCKTLTTNTNYKNEPLCSDCSH